MLLLLINILHEFMYQDPRKYCSVVYSLGDAGFIAQNLGLSVA